MNIAVIINSQATATIHIENLPLDKLHKLSGAAIKEAIRGALSAQMQIEGGIDPKAAESLSRQICSGSARSQ